MSVFHRLKPSFSQCDGFSYLLNLPINGQCSLRNKQKQPQEKTPKHTTELIIITFGLNRSFQFLATVKTSCIYMYHYKFQNHSGKKKKNMTC